MEDKLIGFYIKRLEKTLLKYSKNKHYKYKFDKLWHKIKNNPTLLEYCTKINNNTFISNIIVEFIIKDKSLYNSKIYNKIVNIVFSNKKVARIKEKTSIQKTFLLELLSNENLELTKEQKMFSIYEAEESPCTSKHYEKNLSNELSYHGLGVLDIRYILLKNKNFTLQERKNLSTLLYPDDELKITVLNELEWDIAKKLNINNISDNYNYIYSTDLNIIEDKENRKELLNLIELAKYIKENIPENILLNYKRII